MHIYKIKKITANITVLCVYQNNTNCIYKSNIHNN